MSRTYLLIIGALDEEHRQRRCATLKNGAPGIAHVFLRDDRRAVVQRVDVFD